MAEKFPRFAAYRKSRWYKPSLWIAGIYAVYLLIGFFVLPPIIKSQLLKQLPPITKRKVAVEQVKFNPFVLSLTIRGLSLTEPDGKVAASLGELYVNFQLSSLCRLAWTFDEIALKKPYGHLILFKDGTLNFANMGSTNAPAPSAASPPPSSKPAKSGGLPSVRIGRLHIDEGEVVWDDETHLMPLHIELKPINFGLTNLTTQVGKGSDYSFVAGTDSGKRLAWVGSLITQPFESQGHLELEGIEPRKWTAYLRDHLRAQVTDGRLNVSADYAVGTGTNGFGVVIHNGAVELTGFEVMDANSNEVITTMSLLSIKAVDFDLQGRNLRAGSVKVEGLKKQMEIDKDGKLNLNLLVEEQHVASVATNIAAASVAAPAPSPASAPSKPWVFAIDDLALTNCTVNFADLSRASKFEAVISPILVRVQHFSTKPESDATFDFNLPSTRGDAVSGKGTICITPFRLGGNVNVASVKINNYTPYYEKFLRGEVPGGEVNLGLDYRLFSTAEATELTISNAGVALTDLQLKAADGGETVVAIPSLAVEQALFDLKKQLVEVGLVKSADAKILARQKKDGTINLAEMFGPPPKTNAVAGTGTNAVATPTNETTASAPAGTNAQTRPWTVLIKEVAFTNYAIQWEDQKLEKEAKCSVDQLNFDVKNISTVSNEPITAALSARLNEAGLLELNGTGKISPVMADMDITLSDFDLRPLQPYVNESVRVKINSGQFNLRSHVQYGGEPKLKFTGDLSLTNFVTMDTVRSREFVKWDLLSVSGIDFDLEPNRLSMKEVEWRGFNTSLIVGPDHQLNLKTVLPPKATNAPAATEATTAKAPPPASTPAESKEFPIQLDTFALQNAAFHFADDSIEPHCEFDIADLGGTIKGLSSDQNATATVDLRGKVDAASSFSIAGKVNPLAKDLSLDLTLGFTNTDLTAFSTYLEKYAGHPLNKGKLFMGLHYDIHQKQLKAENNFELDHFTLGARNDSTNATHLPVKLAVALMKDSEGRIKLDIPVTGRTDDPEFRIAPLVLKALMNLMVKAATSPFSLLGSLVGGGGEEMSFVDFTPGRAEVSDAERQKLTKLVNALEQRPALNVEIAGSFDPQIDRDAIARLKLDRKIKTLRLKEAGEAGNTAASADTVSIEPAQRERLLKVILAEMGTNQTLKLQPIGIAETNSPETMTNATVGQAAAVETAAAQPQKPPAAQARQKSFDTNSKGASLLVPGVQLTGLGPVKTPPPVSVPMGTNGAPATVEDIEAQLVAAIQVSDDEKRYLMKHRAEAVQVEILKDKKISPDRVYIVTPKLATAAGQGQSRANLSLD